MNIDKLMDICIQFPDVRVRAIGDEQFNENYNSGYGSWRGSYDEPALFFNGKGYMTLKDLVPYLDELASGDEFEVKDLDLSLDKDMYEKAKRFWEVVVDKQPLKDGEYADGFTSWYKDSYYKDTFGDKETFAKDKASLSTLALLLDGKWHEQGKMGWFGMSDTTSDSLKEYTKFFNKTLEELKETHPHATVTLVDCHI